MSPARPTPGFNICACEDEEIEGRMSVLQAQLHSFPKLVERVHSTASVTCGDPCLRRFHRSHTGWRPPDHLLPTQQLLAILRFWSEDKAMHASQALVYHELDGEEENASCGTAGHEQEIGVKCK